MRRTPNIDTLAACRLLAITLACSGMSCGSILREEPPPPESVWMFFQDGKLEDTVPRVEPRANAERPPGLQPFYYDADSHVVICGTYERYRGPFIMRGYEKDEMVGYLRTPDEEPGLSRFDQQPGVWVRLTLLGTRADDERVRATMERRDARMTGTGRKS